MNLIGLTGGIGSGKSTVAFLFKILGIPVYESDEKAKQLMVSDEDLRKKITALLGEQAYLGERRLNSAWIASQVFSDRDKLDALNAIVHPAVFEDLKNWASGQQSAPYLIQESAIFFEEDLTSRLNAIILVVADEEERISRVMKRDNVTVDQVTGRIENQWRDEEKLPYSDYIIYNDRGRSLIRQVTDIDKMIRERITSG